MERPWRPIQASFDLLHPIHTHIIAVSSQTRKNVYAHKLQGPLPSSKAGHSGAMCFMYMYMYMHPSLLQRLKVKCCNWDRKVLK